MDTTEKVKSRWTRSFFTTLNTRGDQERYLCDICQKDFASPSNLALHCQVHVIERKFKCEPCQVSFHSQGHLQKHKRSSAHETRVEMTQAFGIPTSDNPRPYGCPECDTAFRKHGHLAKHLRSKSHITKLESNGLIPIGTYAALEKSGQDLKDKLVTTNCEQSLYSLRQIAMHIFHQQPMPDELSLGQTSDAISSLAHDIPIPYPSPHTSSSSSSSSISLPHQSMQSGQLFSSRLTPPPAPAPPPPAPLQFHQHQQSPSTLPPMALSSSNMMLSQPSLQPTTISQNHNNRIHQQAQQHSMGIGINGNQAATSQMIMMNMIPHTIQEQSLDYTLHSRPISSSESSTTETPTVNDPYSHLGLNFDNNKQQQQHQNQHLHHHHHQQQHHQLQHHRQQQQQQQQHPQQVHQYDQSYEQHQNYHQVPVTNYSNYNNLSAQQLPISMPSSMSSCPSMMGVSCPSINGAASYMRH